ncbi:hypothetical protein VTN96DRAFT_3835 [Rasamsonia emersonii]
MATTPTTHHHLLGCRRREVQFLSRFTNGVLSPTQFSFPGFCEGFRTKEKETSSRALSNPTIRILNSLTWVP